MAASSQEGPSEFENFTNDSSMMIAYERALETSRSDALFSDPFAEAMAGSKGEALSSSFGAACGMFGLVEWPEFHKTWTAVRTKFIDDNLSKYSDTGTFPQLVNLGAGLDTRPYRLDCYSKFRNGSFEIDMESVNRGKVKVFEKFLGAPKPRCSVHNIDLDFLSKDQTLRTELGAKSAFDQSSPTLFLSEGLIMYLGMEGKVKFVRDVSAVAAPGSVFILQFMNSTESEIAKATPGALDNSLSEEEAAAALSDNGWGNFEFFKFGDPDLNFGRFPTGRFPKPVAAFSFVVCTKVK